MLSVHFRKVKGRQQNVFTCFCFSAHFSLGLTGFLTSLAYYKVHPLIFSPSRIIQIPCPWNYSVATSSYEKSGLCFLKRIYTTYLEVVLWMAMASLISAMDYLPPLGLWNYTASWTIWLTQTSVWLIHFLTQSLCHFTRHKGKGCKSKVSLLESDVCGLHTSWNYSLRKIIWMQVKG